MLSKTLHILAALCLCACTRSDASRAELGTYRLSLSSHAAMPNGAAPFDVDLRAQLEVMAAGAAEQLVMRLVKPEFASVSPEQEQDFAKLARELAQPFTVRFADGRVVEHRVAPGLGALAVATLRSITASMQLPDPSVLGKSRLEWDSTGEYEARYDAQAGGYQKQKLSYKRMLGASAALGRSVLPKVASARLRIGIEGGALASVHSREVLRSPLLQGLEIEVTQELELTREGKTASFAFDAQAFAAASKLVKSDEPYLDPTPQRAFDAAHVGDHTFSEVIAALETQASEDDQGLYGTVNGQEPSLEQKAKKAERLAAHFDAFGALVAMLRSSEPLVTSTLERIRAHSPAQRPLMSALVSSGRQDALISLVRDAQLDLTVRRSATSALLRTDRPSPAAIELLKGLLSDPAFEEHARYGLGSFSRRLRAQGDSALADALVQPLLDELGHESDARRQVILLRGLSNAGYPQAFARVQPFVEAANKDVREAAIEALCLVLDPKVDALYAARLRSEPERGIRELILRRTAQHRQATPALLKAIEQGLLVEEAEGVRQAMVDVLAAFQNESPAARSTLANTASRHRDDALRTLAALKLHEPASQTGVP